MPPYSDDELKDRAFQRVAAVMFGMWQEKGSSDTRLLNPPLIPDEYVVVGESINGRGHKEHVVPRVMICDEAHAMFRDGKSVDEVAAFIRRFLKIVHISKPEQQRLDRSSGLGLKERMPEGWSFVDGDVYARLHAAEINYRLYAEQKC